MVVVPMGRLGARKAGGGDRLGHSIRNFLL